MGTRHKLPLSTLVACILFTANVFAATETSTSEIKETQKPEDQVPAGLPDMNISPTPYVNPAKIKNTQEEVYFPYESSLSPRLGMGTDTDRLRRNAYYYFYGLQYQFPSDNARHWEAGADVMDDGTGILSVGRKFRMNATEGFRPYFKVTGALHAIPSEELTTFLRTDNLQLRPSLGFESFLQHPSSVRVELETWIGLKQLGFHISLGYSYAW